MWTLSLCRSSRVVGSRPARGYLPSRAEFVSEFVEHLAELDFEVLQLLDQPRLVLAHLMTRVHLQRRFHVVELTLNLDDASLHLYASQ